MKGSTRVGQPINSGKIAEREKPGPSLDPPFVVHCEHMNGRPPERGQSGDHRPSKLEVFRPNVVPRMEERHESAVDGVDAREVRPLRRITSVASQGEVIRSV